MILVEGGKGGVSTKKVIVSFFSFFFILHLPLRCNMVHFVRLNVDFSFVCLLCGEKKQQQNLARGEKWQIWGLKLWVIKMIHFLAPSPKISDWNVKWTMIWWYERRDETETLSLTWVWTTGCVWMCEAAVWICLPRNQQWSACWCSTSPSLGSPAPFYHVSL